MTGPSAARQLAARAMGYLADLKNKTAHQLLMPLRGHEYGVTVRRTFIRGVFLRSRRQAVKQPWFFEALVAHKYSVMAAIWIVVLLIVGVGEVALSTKDWVRSDDFIWNLVMYGLIVFATCTTTWILLAKRENAESCRRGDLSNRRQQA